MKKPIIVFVVLAVIAGGTAFALAPNMPPIQPLSTPNLSDQVFDVLTVGARVVPTRSVELNFPTSGIVAEVLVREGDIVKSGTPLARLDTRALQLQVEAAQAGLDRAKADYDKLRAGATPAQIDEARAL